MPSKERLPTSRYDITVVNEVVHTDNTARLVSEIRQYLTKDDLGDNYLLHTVTRGEQLDWLAYKYLGDTRYWWVIADLNRDVLLDIDQLQIPAATQLLVPTREFLTSRRRVMS
jgi:hypothetical protein